MNDHNLLGIAPEHVGFPQWSIGRGHGRVVVFMLSMLAASSVTALASANKNQLSDVWEAAFGVQEADPMADDDADGHSNLQESVAGTDPLNPQSVLRIESQMHFMDAHVIEWESAQGREYQLETTAELEGGEWISVDGNWRGTGALIKAAIPNTGQPIEAVRVRLVTDNPAVDFAQPYLGHVDTDQDGMVDLEEWAAGTNPFDAQSRLSLKRISVSNAGILGWHTVRGKHYELQSSSSPTQAPWSNQAGPFVGDGNPISVCVDTAGEPQCFRVVVADADDDLDGVSDWEERLTGLNFGPLHYRINFPTTPDSVRTIIQSTNVINLTTGTSIANATRQFPASFTVSRSGNLNALTIHYSIEGDAVSDLHYQGLPGSITFEPGTHSAVIPVTPISEAGLNPARSVVLNLLPHPSYVLGTNTSAQINVLKEAAISIADFGAIGDGITDDTFAIQSAINELETNPAVNTLHFPSGVYRLNTPSVGSDATRSWHQLLELGKTDLAGRDLLFTGSSGAVLYSTTSPLRTHILVVRGRFRSLSFRDLKWEKNSNPLSPTFGEPNDADGVNIVYHDLRFIEAVDFFDCEFFNCHRAVSTSFDSGYDTRGRLGHFGFYRCNVLNPFGSNTIEGQKAFGGGQQLLIGPWIANAVYADNVFDGGPTGFPNPILNPGGDRKDGSHFGSPLNLVFTNNTVRNMGVEAVFQTDQPFMGTTSTSLTFPPPDGITPAQVQVYPVASTFKPGQVLNFRTPLTPTSSPKNVLMTVSSYDATNRILSVTNPGLTPDVAGTILPPDRTAYLQEYNPTLALIADNRVIDGGRNNFIGIASDSRATVTRNFIEGYATAIYLYGSPRNPLHPNTPGTELKSNVILTKTTSTGYPAYGVESFGPGEIISDNLVVAPRSYRFVGATVRGTNGWLEANTVLPISVVRNTYDDFKRSVGIGFGNGSSNNVGVANSTYGMDVGIGPENPYQPALHRVPSHFSTNDVLAIDPIGLVP